jgi:MFS family permease
MAAEIQRSRLFNASCFALLTTSMAFAIRAGILGQLGTQFGLSNTELGYITQMAFLGFPIATIVGGPLYNSLGPKRLLALAFVGHLLGIVLTITASGFWGLLISTFLIGFANGSVEAACNPMIADMFANNQTTMLNRFHVWFPGGLVIGSLISKFMTDFGAVWQLQIATMIIPALIYGYLFFNQEFPKNTHLAGSTSKNMRYVFTPLFIFMAFCMTLTATTELGTQQWIEKLLGNAGASPMLVLALVTGIMAVGRYFAGPVVHKLDSTGVLLLSAIVSVVAIYSMSLASGNLVYLSAVLFAIGVCYFWPTMIGFVAERIPQSGALGMSVIGGVGMFATSLWQPVIGHWLDAEKSKALSSGMNITDAELAAGQATLSYLSLFPLVLVCAFAILYFYMKQKKTVNA